MVKINPENFKKFAKKHKKILTICLSVFVIFLIVCIWQIFYLRWAHSSFGNYYKFRGCQGLIEKNDLFGKCRLSDGKVIKIVKFDNKWYLDGDLPAPFPSFQ